MLDTSSVRNAIQAAADKFAATIATLFAEELARLRQEAGAAIPTSESARPPRHSSKPAPQPQPDPAPVRTNKKAAAKASKAAQSAPVRKNAQRPNVILVRAGETPEQAKPAWASPIPSAPAAPARPVDLTFSVARALDGSEAPLSFESLRRRLKVTGFVLTPVLRQLVEEGKVRTVEVDGVTMYKPPRIEPIKRRKSDDE